MDTWLTALLLSLCCWHCSAGPMGSTACRVSGTAAERWLAQTSKLSPRHHVTQGLLCMTQL